MGVALAGDLLQLRSGTVPFLQGHVFVSNDFPQLPTVIGHTAVICRFIFLRRGCVLEGHSTLADMLCLTDDRVLDLPKLLLL